MFNNHDAGDVTGLEAVFRSQQFGRAVGAGGRRRRQRPWGSGGEHVPEVARSHDAPCCRRRSGRATRRPGVWRPATTSASPPGADAESTAAKRPTASRRGYARGRGACRVARRDAAAAVEAPNNGSGRSLWSAVLPRRARGRRRHSGTGQHPSPAVSAQGKHTTGASARRVASLRRRCIARDRRRGRSSPHGRPRRPLVPATLISSRTRRALGAGGAPGGHVSTQWSGDDDRCRAVPAPVTPSASGSTGSAGSPPAPPSTGGNPGTPAGLPVENTVTGVVTSVTDAADQLGSVGHRRLRRRPAPWGTSSAVSARRSLRPAPDSATHGRWFAIGLQCGCQRVASDDVGQRTPPRVACARPNRRRRQRCDNGGKSPRD